MAGVGLNGKEIVRQKSLKVEFSPECDGHIITGKLVNNKSGKGVPNEGVYLSVPSTRTQFRPALSDNKGFVKFELTGFYGIGGNDCSNQSKRRQPFPYRNCKSIRSKNILLLFFRIILFPP